MVKIGGVRTLFRMPDLFSFGLGGGSHVQGDPPRIGPLSVGYRLPIESLAFGGEQLTTTDVAVASGVLSLGDPVRVSSSSLTSASVCLMKRVVWSKRLLIA